MCVCLRVRLKRRMWILHHFVAQEEPNVIRGRNPPLFLDVTVQNSVWVFRLLWVVGKRWRWELTCVIFLRVVWLSIPTLSGKGDGFSRDWVPIHTKSTFFFVLIRNSIHFHPPLSSMERRNRTNMISFSIRAVFCFLFILSNPCLLSSALIAPNLKVNVGSSCRTLNDQYGSFSLFSSIFFSLCGEGTSDICSSQYSGISSEIDLFSFLRARQACILAAFPRIFMFRVIDSILSDMQMHI